jgi:hypothetical protein
MTNSTQGIGKSVLRAALLVAVGAAGMWLWRPAPVAAQSGKVYELRTYHCAPGRLEALKARFRDHTVKLFERHGMKNVGYWTSADAPASADTLIYILAHESREAAKKNWDEFRADAEWVRVKEASEKDGKIVEKVESVYMQATDFSPLQ